MEKQPPGMSIFTRHNHIMPALKSMGEAGTVSMGKMGKWKTEELL